MQPQAATLRLALLPRTLVIDVALVIGAALFVALSAQIVIYLPFTPVPITMQPFAVLLAGASLGAVRGSSAMVLYLLMGLVGAPVYADGNAGAEIIFGASGGYLVSYPFVAAITGRLAERQWDRHVPTALAAMLAGNVAIYLLGVPWLAAVLGVGPGRALEQGLYPFIPGDLLKLALAALLLPGAWKLVRRAKGLDD